MELKIEDWGVVNEKMAQKYTVSDPVTGFLVEVTDFGATLVRVQVPDREGHVSDVTYGHNDPDVYVHGGGGTYGAMVGRYANRIANGTFELDGETYSLFINNANKHSLHGGQLPFHKRFPQGLREIQPPSGTGVHLSGPDDMFYGVDRGRPL